MLILLLVFFSSGSALKCVHDGTISNIVYDHGIIVSSFSHNFELGYIKCSEKLNRCVNFVLTFAFISFTLTSSKRSLGWRMM
ncbi:hypothetical protein PRIPAC_80083 [Pristionchus pacificus]|uniref:Uncharacterized protein n=1 Tax=Pristionchus pacificus TaxID=54126 RepID=A0A2A6C462_PRIPA|nr:hypothetical protein PRIPAC_80083 [Pristionchus pacificus]|eukprot:PDM72833.1 hypothetical protein PRIPAC_39267 [Pristionchus pacificus]